MRNSNSQNIALASSAAADQTGITIEATNIIAASGQAITTGTSTGTFKFQFSNDTAAQCTVDSTGKVQPTHWSDITGQTVAVAGAGTVAIPKFDCCYQFIRTVFVHTNAATGTIGATVNTKAF